MLCGVMGKAIFLDMIVDTTKSLAHVYWLKRLFSKQKSDHIYIYIYISIFDVYQRYVFLLYPLYSRVYTKILAVSVRYFEI